MAEPPVVSVVIPTYDRPQYLREAIESVLKQDYQDLADRCPRRRRNLESRDVVDSFGDVRIVHRVNPRRLGIGANKFSGWRAAIGRYVANLDDDLWNRISSAHVSPYSRLTVACDRIRFTRDHRRPRGRGPRCDREQRGPVPQRPGGGSPRVARADRPGRPGDTSYYGLGYPPRAHRLDERSTGHGCRGRLLARLPRRAERQGRVLRASEPHALPSARRVGNGRWRCRLAPVVCCVLPATAARPAARTLWPELRSRLGACERRTAISQIKAGDARAARRSCRRALAAAVTPATLAVACADRAVGVAAPTPPPASRKSRRARAWVASPAEANSMINRKPLRRVALRIAPRYMAERARRHEQALRQQLGISDAARTFVSAHGDRIQAGPFAGMRYPVDLLTRADCPIGKMRGTYEVEISSALERMVQAFRALPRGMCVDLGCADGYYAAGLARLVPGLEVHAFDLAASARNATRALAEANGVRVNVHGAATTRAVARLAPTTTGLICDIEGAEAEVLTAELATALRESHVIVEMHEGIRVGVCDMLLKRFAASHHATVIEQRVDAEVALLGANEMRAVDLCWGIFSPRE